MVAGMFEPEEVIAILNKGGLTVGRIEENEVNRGKTPLITFTDLLNEAIEDKTVPSP